MGGGGLWKCGRNSHHYKVSPAGGRLPAPLLSLLLVVGIQCAEGRGNLEGLSPPSILQALLPTSWVRCRFLHTHTHTPPHQISLQKLPRERGGATSGPASLLAWLRALPGPLLGSNRGAALSAFHMRLWDRVCVGGRGKAKVGAPVPATLQILGKTVTFCRCV